MKFLIKIVSVMFMLALPLFANSVATITALKGNVKIKSQTVNINATLGATLNEQDSIVTVDKSKAQLIFKDDTIVTVGENSQFSIAKYIFDEEHEPVVELSLIKGAMRAITGRIGKIAPQKFKVRTKTATIGIRGTNFTVTSLGDGSMRAYCTYGAISVVVDGREHRVNHGFQLTLALNGEIKIKEFSAAELKELNADSFGKKEGLKGTGVDADVGLEPDNTVDEFENVVIKDVSDDTQDAAQVSESETTQEIITMSGFSIDIDSSTNMDVGVDYTIAEDGASFVSSLSKVSVNNKFNGYDGEDSWSFQIGSVPSSFVSKDEFSVAFSSVSLSPQSGSTSTDASLVSSNFSATNDDLASDDYMTWGTWNADVEYTHEVSGTLITDTHNFQGLWVAGSETDSAVVNAMLASNVTYSGNYKAYDITTSAIETGSATMTVDFGGNTANLVIGYENGDGTGNSYYKMAITNNTMTGTQTDSTGGVLGLGTANGKFYGPNAEAVGGNFSTNTSASISQIGLKGVYQVSTGI